MAQKFTGDGIRETSIAGGGFTRTFSTQLSALHRFVRSIEFDRYGIQVGMKTYIETCASTGSGRRSARKYVDAKIHENGPILIAEYTPQWVPVARTVADVEAQLLRTAKKNKEKTK